VAAAVGGVLTGERHRLLERVAERMAEEALRCAGGRAETVTVTVRKLRPPVPVDLASAAVTVTRHAAPG